MSMDGDENMDEDETIEFFGAGPINNHLSLFFSILSFNGKRVQFSRTDNTSAIKTLYGWLLQFGQMPDEETQHLKSNAKSKEFRFKGNKLFEKRSDLSTALEMYNKGICWAENGEDLAIGFANRSAVYFAWKLYKVCIDNINLAVEAGVPQRLIAKLDQRRAKCTERMEEDLVNKENGSTETTSSMRALLGTPYPTTLHIHRVPITQSELRRLYAFDIQKRCEPKLSLEANPKIPFIANCLEMKSNQKQGRYIVTKKDLTPGQIISIEEPYTNSLTKEYRYRKCANCFAENFLSLIPCPSCTCTMFCSKKCLIESENGFHQFECPIAEYIWTQCEEFALTLRMVIKAFTTFSVAELNELREKNKKANITAFSFDYRNGLNNEELYSQIDNLLTNEGKRSYFDLFTRCGKVAILYHHLIERTKFGEIIRTERDRDTLISVIMQHSQITSLNCFNCHQFNNIDMDGFQCFDAMFVFSRGMYPFSSLFNHSCAPNIATISAGTKLVTYVTRVIKSGSELFGCYKRINHFEQNINFRRPQLADNYHFECKCEACEHDFLTYYHKNMPPGKISDEIHYLSEVILPNLNVELSQTDKFCSVLQKYDSHYPCLSMYKIGLKLHRALTLQFGNLSTELQVILNDNQLKSPTDAVFGHT